MTIVLIILSAINAGTLVFNLTNDVSASLSAGAFVATALVAVIREIQKK